MKARTSPPRGQMGAEDQNAPHTEHWGDEAAARVSAGAQRWSIERVRTHSERNMKEVRDPYRADRELVLGRDADRVPILVHF